MLLGMLGATVRCLRRETCRDVTCADGVVASLKQQASTSGQDAGGTGRADGTGGWIGGSGGVGSGMGSRRGVVLSGLGLRDPTL